MSGYESRDSAGASRISRRGAPVLPALLVLSLSGCGTDDMPAAADDPLRDDDASAGPVASLALAAEPIYSVTESASDPAFAFVIPSMAVILEDGSSIVADVRTESLVYLDSAGSATRVAGSEGEGPGEFRRLTEILAAPGDSGVWAWDSRSRRLSHFDRSGAYVTSLALPAGALPVAILPGPTFVTKTEREEGTAADPAPRMYTLTDSQWTVVGEIEGPPEPVAPTLVYEVSGITHNAGLPEGCVPVVEELVIGNELFAADAGSGVIRAFAEDGSAREVYRTSRRLSVTPEMQDALERQFTLPGREAPDDVLEELHDRVGDQLPAWERVLADPEGRVWLERPECPPGAANDVFDVVGGDGQLLGTISIPEGTRVLAVRGDNVLVMRLGELRVQHVEMYRLIAAERQQPRP